MTSTQVLQYVSAKWPNALQSPLADAMHGASAVALLEASDADDALAKYERARVVDAAKEHALACLWASDGWTVETLSHNIESAFGMELDADECDDIAREVLGAA